MVGGNSLLLGALQTCLPHRWGLSFQREIGVRQGWIRKWNAVRAMCIQERLRTGRTGSRGAATGSWSAAAGPEPQAVSSLLAVGKRPSPSPGFFLCTRAATTATLSGAAPTSLRDAGPSTQGLFPSIWGHPAPALCQLSDSGQGSKVWDLTQCLHL